MDQRAVGVYTGDSVQAVPVVHEPLRGCDALKDCSRACWRRAHSVDHRWPAVQTAAHNEDAFAAIRVSDPEVRQAGLVVIQRTVAGIVDDVGALETRGRVEPDEPPHAVRAVAGLGTHSLSIGRRKRLPGTTSR